MSISISKYIKTVTGNYLDYSYLNNFVKSQKNCDLIIDINNEDFLWAGIEIFFETGNLSKGKL